MIYKDALRLGALLLILSGAFVSAEDQFPNTVSQALTQAGQNGQRLERAMQARRRFSPPDMFGGPKIGEEAPDFTLKDLKGNKVRLADFKTKKPVALVTGCYSCGIYRGNVASLENLYEKYKDKAAFFLVYTIEAHPKGSDSPYSEMLGRLFNEPGRKEWADPTTNTPQPKSYEDRAKLASQSQKKLKSTVPILVDEMDNAAWAKYGKAPNTAYLIDAEGKVRLRQGWFDPEGFERALKELLKEKKP